MKQGLRIIAGEHKGRRLNTIDAPGTRPMTDRVRESLFSIIQMSLPGSRFLDLFSGSGAVGLEALSRGAAQSTFVEKARAWCKIISENTASLGEEANTVLHCADVFTAVPRLGSEGQQFDIIFIGAPYDLDLHNSTLDLVLRNGILAGGGMIINQYRATHTLKEPQGYICRHKDYGITRLTFLEQSNHG